LPTLRDLGGYDGSYSSQAAAKRATSELTGRFAAAAADATWKAHGPGLSRYRGALVVPARAVAECALLKAIAAQFVMRRPGAVERQARQRELLAELVEAVAAGAPDTLTGLLSGGWHKAADDAARLRVVIDQVAQLTDTSAIAWHAKLVRHRG
jgi:dGTPase